MFDPFLQKNNGQSNVGDTPENKGQCVGLVEAWIDTLKLPHIWGNADDLLNNADKNFYTLILNTPTAIPQKGDIIVWSNKFNGTVGHTGICTGTANLSTFEVFEQNDPLASNCHLRTYNYNYVLGWLRPQGGGSMNMYGGLDLNNPESMKPCVDLFNKWKNGGFVEKTDYDKLNARVTELEKRPTSCPVVDPKYQNFADQVKKLVSSL